MFSKASSSVLCRFDSSKLSILKYLFIAFLALVALPSRTFGQNAEMPQFTPAIYEARELAMDRMQYEAMQLQAEGIVGMQIAERPY